MRLRIGAQLGLQLRKKTDNQYHTEQKTNNKFQELRYTPKYWKNEQLGLSSLFSHVCMRMSRVLIPVALLGGFDWMTFVLSWFVCAQIGDPTVAQLQPTAGPLPNLQPEAQSEALNQNTR
eukprot:2727954-Amphidinium_carterae.1